MQYNPGSGGRFNQTQDWTCVIGSGPDVIQTKGDAGDGRSYRFGRTYGTKHSEKKEAGRGEVGGEEVITSSRLNTRDASRGCGGGGAACGYRPTYIRDLRWRSFDIT